ELAIHEGLLAARERGAQRTSPGVRAERRRSRLRNALVDRLHPSGLRRFKPKFGPKWRDRFLAAPGVPCPRWPGWRPPGPTSADRPAGGLSEVDAAHEVGERGRLDRELFFAPPGLARHSRLPVRVRE